MDSEEGDSASSGDKEVDGEEEGNVMEMEISIVMAMVMRRTSMVVMESRPMVSMVT